MAREIEEPTINEHGDEEHPAFGLIGASRISWSSPGAVLFDSDIRHQHSVRVRISGAIRHRQLNHDWVYSQKQEIEVELSKAQWASFVSSMNMGDGVPCTIRARGVEGTPDIPYAPSLKQTMDEAHGAAEGAFGAIKEKLAEYEAIVKTGTAKQKKEALFDLHCTIQNAVPNVDFAGQQLIKQTEDVVMKARADIEAYVVQSAHKLGIEPGSVIVPVLEVGNGE